MDPRTQVARLSESFLKSCHEEDEALAHAIEALDDSGRRELGGVLGRFAAAGQEALGPRERLLARRILGRIRKPSYRTLVLTNKILDYLDLNADGRLDEGEMQLVARLIELFARVESDNHTLSQIELRMLHAVLRHVDADHSGRLDPVELDRLAGALDDAERFDKLLEQATDGIR